MASPALSPPLALALSFPQLAGRQSGTDGHPTLSPSLPQVSWQPPSPHTRHPSSPVAPLGDPRPCAGRRIRTAMTPTTTLTPQPRLPTQMPSAKAPQVLMASSPAANRNEVEQPAEPAVTAEGEARAGRKRRRSRRRNGRASDTGVQPNGGQAMLGLGGLPAPGGA